MTIEKQDPKCCENCSCGNENCNCENCNCSCGGDCCKNGEPCDCTCNC